MTHPPVRTTPGVPFTRFAPALALVVLVALTRWAGIPRVHPALFVAGAGALIATLFGTAALAWYLLVKPLPAGVQLTPSSLPVTQRQTIAVLLTIGGLTVTIGAFWDEVWHHQYGVPFGEDLLWRPHLLIYFGLLTTTVLAAVGVWHLWRRGQGGVRQRLRSNPSVGWLVLLGAFLLYAVPADPLWHLIYGPDISAWSLPHLILSACFVCIMLVAVAVLLSTVPTRRWTVLTSLRTHDLLIFVALAFALTGALQLLTTEWDVIRVVRRGSPAPFWERPEWLLPVMVVALAAFFGAFATHASRLVGSASAVGLLALAMRAAFVAAFGFERLSSNAWLLTLAPLVTLDLYTLWRVRRGRVPVWPGAALASSVGLALVSLPLLNARYLYPEVNARTLPAMLVISLLTSFAFAWAGSSTGDHLAQADKAVETHAPSRRWLIPTALLTTLAFITWFVGTAQPPI